MLIVQSIKKSENYSAEGAFVSVRFAKRQSGSKFAQGCLNDGETYSASYDLQRIYTDLIDSEGTFDHKTAWKRFKSEMVVGADEEINGYEFSIAVLSGGKFDKVKIAGTDKEMAVMRPATYGDEAHAMQLCVNSLRRQLADKTLVPVMVEDNDDDEDDDQ